MFGKSFQWQTIVACVSGTIVLAAFIFVSMNRPGGPATQVIGVVQSGKKTRAGVDDFVACHAILLTNYLHAGSTFRATGSSR